MRRRCPPRPQQCGDVVQSPLEAGQVRAHRLQAEGGDQGIGRQGRQAPCTQGLGLVHVDRQDPLHLSSQLVLALLPGLTVQGQKGASGPGLRAAPGSAPCRLPHQPLHGRPPAGPSPPGPYPLPSMRQTCRLYTLQSKHPGSPRSQSPSSWRFTSRKSVMVMSSKWAQALSSWYMVGPEPMSMRVRPDTSPGPGRGRGPRGRPVPAAPCLSYSSLTCLPPPLPFLLPLSVCLEKHWFWSRTNESESWFQHLQAPWERNLTL